jgi:hypothetical protein
MFSWAIHGRQPTHASDLIREAPQPNRPQNGQSNGDCDQSIP